MPDAFTGVPDKSGGGNFACRAASTDASNNSATPFTASAEITRPSKSIITLTRTCPVIFFFSVLSDKPAAVIQ